MLSAMLAEKTASAAVGRPLRAGWMTSALLVAVWLLLSACSKNRWPSDYGVTGVRRVAVASAPGIRGRDGGFSFRAWGRTAWVFGDTVLSQPDSLGATWHNNSLSFLEAFDPERGILRFSRPFGAPGAPLPIIPATETERIFNERQRANRCAKKPCTARWAAWAGPGVWDAARGRALIFYQLVYAKAGEFDFEGVGSSIAVWESPDQSARRPRVAKGAHPTLMFTRIPFGSAALADAGWLFAFGCTHDGWEHLCRLGRAPLARAEQRSRWEFWTGEGWAPELSRASVVVSAAPMFSVERNRALGAYAAIYSRPMSNEVVMRTARTLTGPWSAEHVLFDTRATGARRPVYDALAHAELAERDGLVQYISYSSALEGRMFEAETVLVRVDLAVEGLQP